MKTTIMSHIADYHLTVMIDNKVTPLELYTHFLQKEDVKSVSINFDKEEEDEGLLFTSIKVVDDTGYYFNIDSNAFISLNQEHYMRINW